MALIVIGKKPLRLEIISIGYLKTAQGGPVAKFFYFYSIEIIKRQGSVLRVWDKFVKLFEKNALSCLLNIYIAVSYTTLQNAFILIRNLYKQDLEQWSENDGRKSLHFCWMNCNDN